MIKFSKKIYELWRVILPFLFVFFLIHFLKDITQDILKVSTPLDVFGDVKEDLTNFPEFVQKLFAFLGVGSFLGEFFILISIPTILKRKEFSRLESYVVLVTISIIIYFLIVTILDPGVNQHRVLVR